MENRNRVLKSKNLRMWVSAVMLATLGLLWSCTSQLPTAPEIESLAPAPIAAGGISSNQNSDSNPFLIVDDFLVNFRASYLIEYQDLGDLAQQIEVPILDDTLYLILPSNSVPYPCIISVLVLRGTDQFGNLVTQIEFGPDGLQFNPYLEWHHYASAPEGSKIGFYWLNLTGKWQREDTEKVRGGKVVFYIYHFSKYRVYEGSVSASGQ